MDETNAKSWQVDEMRTLAAMLQVYSQELACLREKDRRNYVPRQEYIQVVMTMIHCLEHMADQSEGLLRIVDRMADYMERMTNEIIALKLKAAEDETAD